MESEENSERGVLFTETVFFRRIFSLQLGVEYELGTIHKPRGQRRGANDHKPTTRGGGGQMTTSDHREWLGE